MKRRIENRRFSETGLRELCVSLAAPIPVPRCDRTAPSGSPNYRTSEWAAGSPAAGLPLLALRPRTASLEEVFLDLTDDNDTVAARAAALFQTSVETAEKEAVGDESDL